MHHHTRETSQRKGITVPEIRVENESTRRQGPPREILQGGTRRID